MDKVSELVATGSSKLGHETDALNSICWMLNLEEAGNSNSSYGIISPFRQWTCREREGGKTGGETEIVAISFT